MGHDGGKRGAAMELLGSAPNLVEWADEKSGLWRKLIAFLVLVGGITLWLNAQYHFPPLPF